MISLGYPAEANEISLYRTHPQARPHKDPTGKALLKMSSSPGSDTLKGTIYPLAYTFPHFFQLQDAPAVGYQLLLLCSRIKNCVPLP